MGRDVVRFTALIEAAGALALFALWAPELGWRGALWPAVFQRWSRSRQSPPGSSR